MVVTIGSGQLELVEGDITQQTVDAIVNAANAALAGGGGVDGAIHRAGGPQIMEQCSAIGGCPTGEAVHTTAGDLPARWVIHTVGPIYVEGRDEQAQQLRSCYRRSLEVAADLGARSIAFPSISTGAYEYPLHEAAPLAIDTIITWLEENTGPLNQVRFVLFGSEAAEAYGAALSARR